MRMRWTIAALVLMVALGKWLEREVQPSARIPSRAQLAESLGERRFLEPRLTGGFSYAPCRHIGRSDRLIPSVVCSPLSSSDVSLRRKLAGDIRGIQESVAAGSDAESLQLAGISTLVLPADAGLLSAAVDRLTRAAELAPRDADVLNDLAAARFALATAEDEPAELVRALSTVEEVLSIEPWLPEARFNRALILDRLYLRDQALDAWRSYLRLDDRTGWAEEARQNIARLELVPGPELWKRRLPELYAAALAGDFKTVQALVAQDPQAAREHSGEKLLGEWGDLLISRHGKEAGERLSIVRALGQALRELTGDPMIVVAVQAIDDAAADPGRAADLMSLAQGHRAYRDGMARFRDQLIDEAQPLFAQANDAFTRAHSPCELWALYGLAGLDLSRSHYDDANRIYQTVVERTATLGSSAFQGLAERALGLAAIRQGRFSESLRHYQAAALLLARAREGLGLGAVHEMIAENLRFLGQGAAAWRYRYQAAAELSPYRDSIRLHNVLWEGGGAALEDGYPKAALQIQNEGVRVARRSGSPRMLAEALLWRSKIHLASGDARRSLEDLDWAARLNETSPGDWARKRVAGDIFFSKGKALGQIDPSAAIGALQQAIEFYRSNQLFLDLADAYLGRSQAFLAAGRSQEGEADLTAVIDLFESHQAELTDDVLRSSYAERSQGIFDEMILLQAEGRKNPEAAFSVYERARTIHLARASGLRAQGPVERDILERIPDGAVLIEYAVVRDHLFTWLVQRGRIEPFHRIIEPAELELRINDFVESLRTQQPENVIASASDRLSAILLPKSLVLQSSAELYFVPDKQLNEVPFAALRDPVHHKYLVEEHAIRILPSSSSLLAPVPPGRSDSPSALLVAATEFDRSLFHSLPSLRGVAEEVLEIRGLYRHPTVIEGPMATRSRLLDDLDRHEVFQYGGHAVFNPRHPSHSYLILAPEPGDTGILFAYEIAGRRFEKLRLVILSACSTLGPLESRTGGLSGLARPFLEAGVPAVLGTLWDVEDGTARSLVPEFHRRWLASRNAVESLRGAQLAMMRSSDPRLRTPAAWAAFELVGNPD